MMDHITAWVEAIMGSFWIYPAMFGLTFGDAVFPLIPSESIITLAGAWAGSRGVPDLSTIVIIAISAAIIGDNTCYLFGTRFVRLLRGAPPKSRRAQALHWVETNVANRPGFTIIVARFIPWGRWVLTITLGSMRFPWLKFFFFDTVGILIWAIQAAVIGYAGGRIFESFPLLAIVLGILVGSAIGMAIDKLQARVFDFLDVRAGRSRA